MGITLAWAKARSIVPHKISMAMITTAMRTTKRKAKKGRRTVRRKPKKKAQHNDLVVRPASTFRSIHAIPEGDGNDDSDSSNSEDDDYLGTNEYLSAPPKRKTFVPGKKVPVQPRSVRKKAIRYFPSYTRWMLYLAGLSE